MARTRQKNADASVRIQVLRHINHGLQECGFLLVAVLSAYLLLSLASFDRSDPAWSHSGGGEVRNLGGVAGAWFADLALYFLGHLAYLVPIGILFWAWRVFKARPGGGLDLELAAFRALGTAVAFAAGCALASLHLRPVPGGGSGSGGGILGAVAGRSLVDVFGPAGGTLLLLALFLAGVTLATGLSWVAIVDLTGKLTLDVGRLIGRMAAGARRLAGRLAALSLEAARRARAAAPEAKPVRRAPAAPVEPTLGAEPGLLGSDAAPTTAPEPPRRAAERPAAPPPRRKAERRGASADAAGALPPIHLLDSGVGGPEGYSREDLQAMSREVETLLQHFGIEVRVVAVEPGPVITRFELAPAPGVKVSQISNLAKDLARGLSVPSVRIVEVIPGKSVVGLEIPNRHRQLVTLGEILTSPAYQGSQSPLCLALGVDIGGRPVVANLARMPHLLVAGTTGSGKSVALNVMLLSMLYKAGPEQVRLILVDPKMLELSIYEGIPHLLAPVVTDMKDAANALRWCVAEMERRYRLLAALKVRNLVGFNRQVADAIAAGDPIPDPLCDVTELAELGEPIPTLEPLPYIVVVIDELADMMMIVGKKVEELIARLAQKARASGIHLILATQRPSVDVITGLIKANIPTRIAFQVSAKGDSRIILDQMGAEALLGHGDMLYLPPGTGFTQRVHGAFVDDHEVHRVVEFLKESGAPEYVDDILEEPLETSGTGFALEPSGNGYGGAEADPLYDQAVRVVTESRRASISGVQRRLKIGYNRAARLIEEMESAGIVGALQPNGSREVLAPPPPEA